MKGFLPCCRNLHEHLYKHINCIEKLLHNKWWTHHWPVEHSSLQPWKILELESKYVYLLSFITHFFVILVYFCGITTTKNIKITIWWLLSRLTSVFCQWIFLFYLVSFSTFILAFKKHIQVCISSLFLNKKLNHKGKDVNVFTPYFFTCVLLDMLSYSAFCFSYIPPFVSPQKDLPTLTFRDCLFFLH